MPTINTSSNRTALEKFSKRTPLGSDLRTNDWDNYSNYVKDKAFFSASVNNAKILSEMKSKIAETLKVAKSDPKKAFMSRDKFVSDMKDSLERKGYALGGTKLTDITSNKRLSLIYNMNKEEALGYAKYKKDTCNTVALNMYPAYELIRVEERKVKRNWKQYWIQSGGQLFNGKMIALKDDEIWSKISRFNKPYPPFDFNSGMGIEDVSRDECIEYGLLEDYEDILPASEDDDYKLSNDVSNVDKELLSKLESACEKRGLYAIQKDGVLQLSSNQNAFENWSVMNLPSAKTWKNSDSPIVETKIKAEKALSLLKEETVKIDPLKQDITFNDEVLNHWKSGNKTQSDINGRLVRMQIAMRCIEDPKEIWKLPNGQMNYLNIYKSGDKIKGIGVFVLDNKVTRTWFLSSLQEINKARNGKRIYEK